ncbi:hypothetical protein [Paenibacillus sp. MBLB4367]|uniref:hypothetical protein n=1 Tax=Paenibacillus sp. MBLB4367 TaxID=3384767 RepID=UPI0039081673
MTKSRRSALYVRKKNQMKIIKTVVQAILLIAVGVLLFHAIFDIRKYDERIKRHGRTRKGSSRFLISASGRSGTPKLVAKSQLIRNISKCCMIRAIRTISQQDILDFYRDGQEASGQSPLSVLEDGRNDSGLFAQPLLEKYNFKATFLSYANKMGNSDRKFLQPKDMLKMVKNGYWELGSNGVIAFLISIFSTKEGRFIGERRRKSAAE